MGILKLIIFLLLPILKSSKTLIYVPSYLKIHIFEGIEYNKIESFIE